MVDRDIINFIKKEKEKNLSEKKIRKALINVGFEKSDVKSAFKYIEDEQKTLNKLKKDLLNNKLDLKKEDLKKEDLKKDKQETLEKLKKDFEKSKVSKNKAFVNNSSKENDLDDDLDDDLENISFFTDESLISDPINSSSKNNSDNLNKNYFDNSNKNDLSSSIKNNNLSTDDKKKSKDQKFWDDYKFVPKKEKPINPESFNVNFKGAVKKNKYNSYKSVIMDSSEKGRSLSSFQKMFLVFGLLLFLAIIFFFFIPNNFFSLHKTTSQLNEKYLEKQKEVVVTDCNSLDQYSCYANPKCEVVYDRTGGYLTYIECRST
jgi:hypothetical protein